LIVALERLRGRDEVERTFRALPREIERAIRDGAVVASGWYPIDWYRELHAAMRTACRETGYELAHELGREATQSDFSGIYRLMLRVVSSELLVSQAPRIFRMYFAGGEVGMAEVDSGWGVIEFVGWHGFDRAIWADVMGGIEGILLARQATDVRSRVIRGGGSDGSLRVEYRWSMEDKVAASSVPPA